MEVGQGQNWGCRAKGGGGDRSELITVAARFACARSNTGIVGSNPTQGMIICLTFSLLFCVGRGLATG
jgi:hypothetical protein